MRFLLVQTYYPAVLSSLYQANRGLARRPYAMQWRALMAQCFGTADFYSRNLQALGHQAEEVVMNCRPLQWRWAMEHAVPLVPRLGRRSLRGRNVVWPVLDWRNRVLLAQVHHARPDVVYVFDPSALTLDMIEKIRRTGALVVLQTGSPVAESMPIAAYDAVLSSLPHLVKRVEAAGGRGRYLPLAFEPSVLERLGASATPIDVSFVGGLSPADHGERTDFLERLARVQPFEWWGYGVEHLSPDSPLRTLYRGPAWGLDMYRILQRTRISLNRHAKIAQGNANNMRLYEATGVGSMLLTDRKANLHTLFEVGREVVDYDTVAECAAHIRSYLAREPERAATAAAGQARTLRDHTYRARMREMLGLMAAIREEVAKKPRGEVIRA